MSGHSPDIDLCWLPHQVQHWWHQLINCRGPAAPGKLPFDDEDDTLMVMMMMMVVISVVVVMVVVVAT